MARHLTSTVPVVHSLEDLRVWGAALFDRCPGCSSTHAAALSNFGGTQRGRGIPGFRGGSTHTRRVYRPGIRRNALVIVGGSRIHGFRLKQHGGALGKLRSPS